MQRAFVPLVLVVLDVCCCFLGLAPAQENPIDSGTTNQSSVRVVWNKDRETASVVVRADSVGDLDKLDVDVNRVTAIKVTPADKHVPDLKPLKRFPALEMLDIWFVPINDDALPVIVELKTLRSLYLSGTMISDKGVADELCRCTWLTELWLRGGRISNASLPFLGKLTNLRRLALPVGVQSPALSGALKREGLEYLKPLRALEELFLPGGLDDRDLLALAELSSLKRVRFPKGSATPTVDGLFELKRLAPRIRIAVEVINRIGGGPFTFDEDGEPIALEDFDMAPIIRLGAVEDLSSVKTVKLYYPPKSYLPAALPGLTRLTLVEVPLTGETVQTIAKFKKLRECHFERCKVKATPEELRPLFEMKLDVLTGAGERR